MDIEITREGKGVRSTYYSLDDAAEAALLGHLSNPNSDHGALDSDSRDRWRGGSFPDCLQLAREGWTEHLDSALEIASSAVETTLQVHDVETFQPVWDVSGADVDVARYLSGEPECMVDFPVTKSPKDGRVVTLCASMCYSGSVAPEDLIARGKVVTALALALSQIGVTLELWCDMSSGNGGRNKIKEVRVLVKGANDTLDPARILFAYAHPGMLRALAFGIWNGQEREGYRSDGGYGQPNDAAEDLPEGTIYLPSVLAYHGNPDAHLELRKLLKELGLIEGE